MTSIRSNPQAPSSTCSPYTQPNSCYFPLNCQWLDTSVEGSCDSRGHYSTEVIYSTQELSGPCLWLPAMPRWLAYILPPTNSSVTRRLRSSPNRHNQEIKRRYQHITPSRHLARHQHQEFGTAPSVGRRAAVADGLWPQVIAGNKSHRAAEPRRKLTDGCL